MSCSCVATISVSVIKPFLRKRFSGYSDTYVKNVRSLWGFLSMESLLVHLCCVSPEVRRTIWGLAHSMNGVFNLEVNISASANCLHDWFS